MKIKDRIKKLRKELNLTQEQFAHKISYSRTAISAWEIGRNEPSNDDTLKLADFFNVSTDFLLGKTDIRNYEESSSEIDVTGLDDDDIRKIQEYADLLKCRKSQEKIIFLKKCK